MTTYNVVFIAYFWVILFSRNYVANAVIGINWGLRSQIQMIPSMVVDLLLQNNIPSVKVLGNDEEILSALCGTNIDVSITIRNPRRLPNYDAAEEFVTTKILPFPNVKFQYVVIGFNAIGDARFVGAKFSALVDLLKNVQSALDKYSKGHIKATLSHSFTSVLKFNHSKPSEAQFTDDIKDDIMPSILKILNETGAPFLFDIFPIAFSNIYKTDIEYAMFDKRSPHVVTDVNGLKYTNVLDFVHDSFIWALKKEGYDNIKVKVGQIGWPTDGYPNANIEMAERFHKGLLPYVASNRGTPMKPGAPIDIYIHSLTDEKQMIVNQPFARHWGIYRPNGTPKYKIDLTGQGRDIYPTSVKGVNLMPPRWCVFNRDLTDGQLVKQQNEFACSDSDCTSVLEGASCSMLDYYEKVSYGFNMYFQTNFQAESACDFEGLGKITTTDPSRDGCIFSVEVVRGHRASDGGKLRIPKVAILPIFVLIFSVVLML